MFEAHCYLSLSTVDHAEVNEQPEDKQIEFILLFAGLRDRDYFLRVMDLALIVSTSLADKCENLLCAGLCFIDSSEIRDSDRTNFNVHMLRMCTK